MKHVIVVTGATGNVGRRVAERLLTAGLEVRVIARTAEKLAPLGALGADVRPGRLGDPAFLTQVFDGATAAFLLTPADLSTRDVNAEQKKNIQSMVTAIRDSGLPNAVLLSSWGAELPDPVGGIVGCHHFELLLKEIPALNVVCLRPVWFMENFLWNIGLIKMAGINGLAIEPRVRFPMIATRDIAAAAANHLQRLDFRGHSVRYLNGPRDYTMTEVTQILGGVIGKPQLRYINVPERILRKGVVNTGGLSPNAADLLIETNRGINSGRITAEPRSTSNTTPTTLEEFAKTTFAPAFGAVPDPSLSRRLAGRLLRSVVAFDRANCGGRHNPHRSSAAPMNYGGATYLH
ncbi:NAD(P)H-binding protein [Mycobacterium talmoniae]|uniref:Quinone oxidoreductase 2 n=1 Tax=Mycobacterium talmoniae TaxID=1858794 RepID=A0A1S1NI10_9MYCO|nr:MULTISPECIES: NAD(P)H-binding protein [Mycobacterium]OHV05522.1 hypothetical protein BKN37_05510 [Mycobacterium talmoniae]PQM44878.1 Quinone oxidoreductase 2 [Mycobacterium talmoniae]TDH57199.1 NAD-dependent epimerase/dehydratase family protein [Mycobacterium eburneum]